MNTFIRDYLPWLMSALTIYMTLLQGKKRWYAWVVGLANQFLWLAFAIGMQTWGLLPLNAVLWVLYTKNLRTWLRDEREARAAQQDGPGEEDGAWSPGWLERSGLRVCSCAGRGECDTCTPLCNVGHKHCVSKHGDHCPGYCLACNVKNGDYHMPWCKHRGVFTIKPCQHDLLAADTTVLVDPSDNYAARCTTCRKGWRVK